MAIIPVQLDNTFDEWRTRTNELITQGEQTLVSVNDLYARSNSIFLNGNTSYNIANAGLVQANTARDHANAAHLTANAGFVQANTARLHANAAFLQANTARTLANSATNLSAGAVGQVPYQSATGVTAYLAVGTSGQVLVSRGATAPAWASLIPAGTVMLFNQTTAPTGWTKSVTHNDKALRVVSGAVGSGGTSAFSAAFSNRGLAGGLTSTETITGTVGGTTLTIAEMPAHQHTILWQFQSPSGGSGDRASYLSATGSSSLTELTGGSQPHTHPFTGGAHSHTVSGSIDMSVQYVDVIFATKDAY